MHDSTLLHPDHLDPYALPALPTWIISPVGLSSLLRTGQLAPSALTSVISSFVPSILNLLSSGLIVEKRGNSVW